MCSGINEAEEFLFEARAKGRTSNVKVGIDAGRALVQISDARPTEAFLGIEIKPEKCKIAVNRISRMGLGNAAVLNAEAQSFFSNTCLRSSVDCVHVYFPTPFQKSLDVVKKPEQDRLMNLQFLKSIFSTLVLGGELRFLTDVEEYFLYLENRVNTSRWWLSDWEEYRCGQPAGSLIGTPCEQKFRNEGRPIYAAVLQKIRNEY